MPPATPTIPSINSQFPIHHEKWPGLEGHPEMDLPGAGTAPGDMGQFDLGRGNALLNNRMQQPFFSFGGGERAIDVS